MKKKSTNIILIIISLIFCIYIYVSKFEKANEKSLITTENHDIFTIVNLNMFYPVENKWSNQKKIIVSLFENGKQRILDTGIDFDTYYREVTLDNTNATQVKTIQAKEYYNSSSYGYDNLEDGTVIEYNGKLTPVKSKITYKNFEKSRDFPEQKWIDSINKANIVPESTNSEIKIRDAYLYENNDIKISIINAAIEYNSNSYYNISAVFLNENSPIFLDNNIEDYKLYDKWNNQYLIADIDGDGGLEIIRYKDSFVEVYGIEDLELSIRFKLYV